MTPPCFAVDKITQQTHCLSPRHSKAHTTPACLSFTKADAAPIAGMTAFKGLHDVGKSRAGKRVLVGVRDKIAVTG
ncbi:hypothetical protein [Sorangium sp. So ce363]|uniref:hypothetical protein n=1 Tax=Sorangium sp. So ce363 TaxID=3133304 RepID=UPI003F5F453D